MHNRRNTLYGFIILCLLAGLLTGRAFFFSLSYLFGAVLFIAFFWSWLSVRQFEISRKTRVRYAQVGRRLGESFTLRNRSFLPKLWLEVIDYSDLPGHSASHIVPLIGPRSAYRWTADTLCIVRGIFTLGPLGISSMDPFGLYRRERRSRNDARIVVYPQTVAISKFDSPAGPLSGGEPRRQRSPTTTSNASGVRDYVSGDSFSRIHWASTARRDMLTVKEFEIDPQSDVWLFVDFSADSLVEMPGLRRVNGTGAVLPRETGTIPGSTEEYAVVAAASIANYFVEEKRALGMTAYIPQREVLQPERGYKQMLGVLETLAVARATSQYTFAETLVLETAYLSRGTTLIMITSSLDAEWVFEAQILAQKGIRPMAVLIDPTSFGAHGSIDEMEKLLRAGKIPSITLHYGDDLSATLSQPAL
ncbi:MAG: DUF58 domain-containing protein [Pleurocapsa minor GSE-CHR-MK-17-07R]|jgi:uncharacterized protein (DUF58 family)|nr:DUF58 domain-containing protein [Pleurocapsa minor GSE-CHR-MK 17-07R]